MDRYEFSSAFHRVVFVTLMFFATNTVFASTFSTDFEDIGGFIPNGEGNTDFNVGPAHFIGGISGVAGVFELYRSGTHAWMVDGGETGIIEFSPGQYVVSFFAKAYSGSDGDTVINAFDTSDNMLASLTLTSQDPFTPFIVSGALDRIEFINNDSDDSRMNTLDDFSLTTVPVPAAIWLFASALVSIVGWSRQSRL
ncbi:MAG: hypothetical protein ACU836_07490 [Gammaproteobacteria bacterium]